MRRLATFLTGSGAVLILAFVSFQFTRSADAQSGTRYQSESRRSSTVGQTRPRRSFEERFWSWLQTVHYENWAPAAGQDGGYYPGQSPHGAFLKMYLNRTAAADPKNLPSGSIVIKENYGEDQKTLMAITIMYRSNDYNPDAGDWYWVKYLPDGRVDRAPEDKGGMPLAGKVQGCIDCHSDANGDDYAFMND